MPKHHIYVDDLWEKTTLALEAKLDQLATHLPPLTDTTHPAGELWQAMQHDLVCLSGQAKLQASVAETINALSDITDTVTGVDDLAQTIVDLIQERFDFYQVNLFLLDTGREEIKLRAGAGRATPLSGDAPISYALNNETAIGRAIQTEQTIIVSEDTTENWPQPKDNTANDFVEIVLPLSNRSEVLGALSLLTLTHLTPFSWDKNWADLLNPVATQAANAIQTARLFATVDRQLEQMAALYHISLQMGGHLQVDLHFDHHHDFGLLLDEVAQLSLQLADADVGIIRLIGSERQTVSVAGLGSDPASDPDETALKQLDHYITQKIAQTKQSLLANNWPQHPLNAEYASTFASDRPILALMIMPVMLNNQTIGTMAVYSFSDPQAFSESDLHILSLLASQAAIAIENTHLFNQAENNSRFLKTIIEHIPDPIFIKDRHHTWIEMNQANAEVIGRPPAELIGKTDYDFFPTEWADRFYHRDDEVFTKNHPLTFEDQTVWADGKEHVAFTRLIPVPSKADHPDFLLGITHDITERKKREIEREKLLSEMAMLYNGSQAIASALSEKQLFEAFFQQIQTQEPDKILAYYFKYVDGEPIWAELEASWYAQSANGISLSDPVHHRLYLPDSPQTDLLTAKEPRFMENLTTDPDLSAAMREYCLEQNVQAAAVLPMTTTGQVVGVTLVCFNQPHTFTRTIKRFWRAMVDQTSVLLANRRLIQEVTSRAIQIETAAEVARTASTILDVQQLLNSAVRLIRDRFDLYYVGVFLVDEAKGWAVLRAGTGEAGRVQLQEGHRLKIGGESMIGWSLAHLKARIALDVGKEAVHFQNPHLPKTRSEIALPLIYRGEAIGALTVQSIESAAFSQQDTIFLQTMADQLANAIENARLFEKAQQEIVERERAQQETLQRNRELAAVSRVTKAATTTLDLQTVLQETTREIVQIFEINSTGIALLSEDRTTLRVVVTASRESHLSDATGYLIPVKDNPSSQRVIETGKSLMVTDAQNNPLTGPIHELMKERKVYCILIVPLKVRDEVIGTLGIDTTDPDREFTPSEIALAETIAGQIAGAMENARLFEQMERALEEQKKSEVALRQAEENYRSIVQNSIEGIFQSTPTGHYLSVNPALARIYNYDSPEHLMSGLTDIKHQLYVDPNRRAEFMRLVEVNGAVSEFESQVYRRDGEIIWISENARTVRDEAGQLLHYEGTVTDITERKRTEKNLRDALARTQSLYRISDALATTTDQRMMFERILGEYLNLLELERGGIMLLNETTGHNELRAMYVNGQPVEPKLSLSLEEDRVGQHLLEHPVPLVIDNVRTHPTTKGYDDFFGQANVMLLIPLLVREQVVGRIGADSPHGGHVFSQDDIETGQAIADQLAIWLENRWLLEETQQRSRLLQTAADVSRTASSILDVDTLINRSVNLIRDKFDFYYVGLFLLDPAGEWAVLRAGTGEAGRVQLAKEHQLEVGGESMIGWCVKHRQARIALDVGEEAVHFQNPDLPDTHSEMALPLISRDEVLGALTVQSVEREAFSDEDITLLQTMADQLANTIKNAYLFEELRQTQEEAEDRLQETIALQQLSQALSGTLQVDEILDIFFRACTKVIGFEYILFSQVDRLRQRVRAIDGRGVSEYHLKQADQPLDSNDIMADILRNGQTEIIRGWDERLNQTLYREEKHNTWVRLFMPVTLRQENVGLVEAGFKYKDAQINESQIRLLRAFVDQTILALDNAQRYEASERAARREALIKEITTKVRASTDIDTILRTTVREVKAAIPGKQVYINLLPPKNGQIDDEE